MMKIKLTILYTLIGCMCCAQSNVVEAKRYELKGGVSEVRMTSFYLGTKKINRITDMTFEDGYLQSLVENHLGTNIKDSSIYQYQKNWESFALIFKRYENKKKIIDSTSNFQQVTFQNLKFYYPKYQLSLQQRNYPNSLDVTYNISGEKYYTILVLHRDSSITESNKFHDFRVQNFNQKGQLISQKFSNRYLNKYYYNENDQIVTDYLYQNIMKRRQERPIKTSYFYENDAKGNWIKRVAITPTNKYQKRDEIFVHLTTRKIKYNDGMVSGSSEYCASFVKQVVQKYKQ